MANYYSPYFNPYQQAYQTPNTPITQPQTAAVNQTSGILWVQGESGAKSYPVAPNISVQLMDSESNRFFIKTADNSGMPMPLRIFEYTEITGKEKGKEEKKSEEYATKKDLAALKEEIVAKFEVKEVKKDE